MYDRSITEIDEAEATVMMLESRVWQKTIRELFKNKLDTWKSSLLTNQTLRESDRIGYIIARRAVLEELQLLYKSYNLELPQWLEE